VGDFRTYGNEREGKRAGNPLCLQYLQQRICPKSFHGHRLFQIWKELKISIPGFAGAEQVQTEPAPVAEAKASS
jgi:hypothetical protein